MTMSTVHQQVLALPAAKTAPSGYFPDPASINKLQIPTFSKKSEQIKKKSLMRKKKTESFTNGARDQNKLGPKLTETVKRKISLGAKILQMGGLEKIYKRLFRVYDEEKLFKAYQCDLSTTAGPMAGLLFISSKKNCFLQREIYQSGFSSGRSNQGSLQSVNPIVQDQWSEPECRHEEAISEVP